MESSGASVPEPVQDGPRSGNRSLLRLLYAPYVWLVFMPYLALSTLVLGFLAVALGPISKRLAFHCGTLWALSLCLANFTRVRVRGREHVRAGQSYVVMCNHQSLFDSVAIYAHWRHQFRWVMKQELRRVPGLGWGCANIGHIFIDRSSTMRAIASLRASRHLLRGGVSVMFFPEGTRSRGGRMGRFKKGGFMMATELDLPILPVSISGSSNVLPSHSLRLLPGTIELTIHPPVDVQPFSGSDGRVSLMTEVASRIASGLRPHEQPLPQSAATSD